MVPKFRCFDKETKNIQDVLVIDFSTGTVEITQNNVVWFMQENNRSMSEVILMQSTGLHDNTKFKDLSEEEQKEWLESRKTTDEWQGREIFQGDVVKIVYDGEPFTGVVVYDLGETDFKATNNREDYGNNFQYLTVGESIEVIGDIHKNPELLEDV